MAVIKEFICMAHGVFESETPQCPHGCRGTGVERAFITPQTIPRNLHMKKMGSASGIDKTLRSLADDYNMTDMKHNGNNAISGGDSAAALAPRWGQNGLKGLQADGHQLGDSGLQVVQHSLPRPESMIPSAIRAQSAKELK